MWLEIAALLVGPLIGIWVTRLIDRAKETGARRYAIFETLMRTRGLELNVDHVGAINLVPVVFKRCPGVVEAWGRLMDAYSDGAWEADDPKLRSNVIERAAKCRTSLLQAIASAVDETLPAREEHRMGYAPKAWATLTGDQFANQSLLKEVLSGQRPLIVTAAPPPQPPAPPGNP